MQNNVDGSFANLLEYLDHNFLAQWRLCNGEHVGYEETRINTRNGRYAQ